MIVIKILEPGDRCEAEGCNSPAEFVAGDQRGRFEVIALCDKHYDAHYREYGDCGKVWGCPACRCEIMGQ